MEYYRNKSEIISLEGVHVEKDFLWEKRGQLMVLVDEDQYVTYFYSIEKFYAVSL